MQSKEHWEKVYSTRQTTEVSWFQQHAATSMRLIAEAGISHDAALIDVGGGASTLVDDLLGQGFNSVTVLDISAAALAAAKERLGEKASRVQWIEASITDARLSFHAYDLWHDRAVFHFLTSPEERQAYMATLRNALKPGGYVVIFTFADDGPTKCSGLPVMRYSIQQLQAEFGATFRTLDSGRETHVTPAGNEQRFIYCLLQRTMA